MNPHKKVCQYPVPENPNGVCGNRLYGHGRSRFCPKCQKPAEADYAVRYSQEYRDELRDLGILEAMQNAHQRHSRSLTRRDVMGGALALATSYIVPDIAAGLSVASGSRTEDQRLLDRQAQGNRGKLSEEDEHQDEEAFQGISQFRHDLLTLPRPFHTIAQEARFFVEDLHRSLQGRADPEAKRLRVYGRQLLLDVGAPGHSLTSFRRLDRYAEDIGLYWLFDEQNYLHYVHSLFYRTNLTRVFGFQVPKESKAWYIQKARQYGKEGLALLRGLPRNKTRGANGDRELEFLTLLHQGLIWHVKLFAYDPDPAVRALVSDSDIAELEKLARRIDAPQIHVATLLEKAGYEGEVHGDHKSAIGILHQARHDHFLDLPVESPVAEFPLLRAENDRFLSARDSAGEGYTKRYYWLYNKFPAAYNREHILRYLKEYELDSLPKPKEVSSILVPCLPLLEMDPAVKEFYGRMDEDKSIKD